MNEAETEARVAANLNGAPPARAAEDVVERQATQLLAEAQALPARGLLIDAATYAQLRQIATDAAHSGTFGELSVEAATVRILYGHEIGLSPMAAMRGLFEGKNGLEMTGNAIATLIRKSGSYDYGVGWPEGGGCVVTISRDGQALGSAAFGPAEAQRAGLATKEVYKKYPEAMYFNRAMSAAARTHCPDIGGGAPIYTIGETAEANEELIEGAAAESLATGAPAGEEVGGESESASESPTTAEAPAGVDPETGELTDPAAVASEAESAPVAEGEGEPAAAIEGMVAESAGPGADPGEQAGVNQLRQEVHAEFREAGYSSEMMARLATIVGEGKIGDRLGTDELLSLGMIANTLRSAAVSPQGLGAILRAAEKSESEGRMAVLMRKLREKSKPEGGGE